MLDQQRTRRCHLPQWASSQAVFGFWTTGAGDLHCTLFFLKKARRRLMFGQLLSCEANLLQWGRLYQAKVKSLQEWEDSEYGMLESKSMDFQFPSAFWGQETNMLHLLQTAWKGRPWHLQQQAGLYEQNFVHWKCGGSWVTCQVFCKYWLYHPGLLHKQLQETWQVFSYWQT